MSFTAKDLMQRDVAVVDASASLLDLERSFGEAKVSGFPVLSRGRVVGVISRADVLERIGRPEVGDASTFYADLGALAGAQALATLDEVASRAGEVLDQVRVEDLMTRSVVSVAPDDSLEAVATTLVEHGVHRALVIDGTQLVGIVSSLDLTRLIARGKLGPTV